jgi:hypothetical protein
MDIGSTLISILLFAAFVPGVLVRLPKGGSAATVLVTHAVLFAAVASGVMSVYWSWREHFGNFGPVCPNGFAMTDTGSCIPVGKKTYEPGALKLAQ